MRACSIGLAVQEPHRGAYFSVLNALLALQASEPDRILRALTWEATVTSSLGGIFRRWASSYLRCPQDLRTPRTHLQSRRCIHGAGLLRVHQRELYGSGAALRDAETTLSETTGASWELGTIRTYQSWVAVCVGDLVGLAAMARAHFQDARERGDRYTAINIGEFGYVLHLLAEDRPAAAAALLRECDSILPPTAYRLQQLMGGIGRTWVKLREQRRTLRSIPAHALNYAQMREELSAPYRNLAVWASDVRARAAIGMAEMLLAKGEAAGEHLNIAARDARFLERSSMPHAHGFSKVIRAGLAAFAGNADAAAGALDEAVAIFDSRGMGVFAATARRRLGQLRGGEAGRELVDRAEQFLRDQRVANIEKLTRLYVCGISGPH